MTQHNKQRQFRLKKRALINNQTLPSSLSLFYSSIYAFLDRKATFLVVCRVFSARSLANTTKRSYVKRSHNRDQGEIQHPNRDHLRVKHYSIRSSAHFHRQIQVGCCLIAKLQVETQGKCSECRSAIKTKEKQG